MPRIDWNAMEELRDRIVRTGKRGHDFRQLAVEKDPHHTRAKYWNVNDVTDSGATELNDWRILARLLEERKPKVILEIGTWFGTSAYGMAAICRELGWDPEIWTCDWHRVLVRGEGFAARLHYRNCISTEMLAEMEEKGVKPEFAFVDANLRRGDVQSVLRLMASPILMAFHDYSGPGNQKGKHNAARFLAIRPGLRLLRPPVFGFKSTIGVLGGP